MKSSLLLAVPVLLAACGQPSSTSSDSQVFSASAPAAPAGSQVLFDAAANCQANPLANYWRCNGPVATISPPALSATTHPFLKALGATNRIMYSFKCKSSSPLIASLSGAGGLTIAEDLASSVDGAVQTIETVVHPETDHFQLHVHDPSSGGTAIVRAGCNFTVLSNVSEPILAPISAYLEQAERNVIALKSTYTQVSDQTAGLDAETALSDGLTIVQARQMELVGEWSKATNPDDRDYYCKLLGGAWTVGGEVNKFGQIDILSPLSPGDAATVKGSCLAVNGQVTEGSMTVAYENLLQCTTASSVAPCTDAVQAGRAALRGAVDQAKTDINLVLNFLDAETTRLQGAIDAMSQTIGDLVKSIRNALV